MTVEAEMLHYEFGDGIATMRLDDGKANALTREVCDGLRASLARAADDGAGALVLWGRVGMFSAGIDLGVVKNPDPSARAGDLAHIAHTLLAVWTAPLPTIAAVTGHAIAGGAILAMACDVRIGVAAPVKIGTNETALGMVFPTWASAIVTDAIRPECRNEVMLAGRLFDSEGAVRVGILHETAPVDGLDIVVGTIATELAALPTRAYAGNKAHLRGAPAAAAAALVRDEMGPAFAKDALV